ncbi:transcriptional regulator [Methylomonas sp. HYX-M1]|uniref:helix-turn-helix transcriptional regulator n=1 Tax=Methylomonas sp. HYX-M1 TaxID=3139307 RepID=UPI00345BD1C4
MIELLDEIHPGEILLEDFMKPMGISARQLAADIDVPPVESANWSMANARSLPIPPSGWVCFSAWNLGSG